MTRPDKAWRADAACRGLPVALFFPDATRPDAEQVAKAKTVCARYPARQACADAGAGESQGIWGGLTGAVRAARRRQQREAA
jgi:WhiB family redox-sensing transcriptional regulator